MPRATGWTTGWRTDSQTFPGSKLEGIGAQHPFLPRTSIVLTADFVTMDTGTGAVHIAPGHGEDDYSLGNTNGLPILSPVDDHGRYTEEVGLPELVGKYVFDANADIVGLLRERGMLLAEQIIQHSYPYCWRSKTPIIFRAVEQFFIRIDDLRAKALEAITQVNWIPAWGENRISGTVESRPDWVISRQRSWGVPLPVFYSADGEAILESGMDSQAGGPRRATRLQCLVRARRRRARAALGLPEGTRHRNDTIDVWIDSGVSHQAVCATHPDAARSGRHVSGSDRPASRLVPIVAHDQRRAARSRALQDLCHPRLRGRCRRQENLQVEHLQQADGRGPFRRQTRRRHRAAVGQQHQLHRRVPFSEEMFTRLGDTYRRIRNTLRILLGNLHDFRLRRMR